MLLRIGYELILHGSDGAGTFDAAAAVHAPSPARCELATPPDRVHVEPEARREEFLDGFGNRCTRVVAPAGRFRFWNETLVEDSGEPDAIHADAVQHAVEELPAETLPFLMASRYCEVDRLSQVAWDLFDKSPLGWGRVQAVCDWVHGNVRFGYQFARPTKSAFDVFTERTGVCRDFTHLAIAFCRCLNIPARYATGYLGDIGVPLTDAVMDFSAWFEVFLSGRWHTFDARHNRPRIGRVLMARGRDAVDVALTTSFGPNTLEKFTVYTDEVPA